MNLLNFASLLHLGKKPLARLLQSDDQVAISSQGNFHVKSHFPPLTSSFSQVTKGWVCASRITSWFGVGWGASVGGIVALLSSPPPLSHSQQTSKRQGGPTVYCPRFRLADLFALSQGVCRKAIITLASYCLQREGCLRRYLRMTGTIWSLQLPLLLMSHFLTEETCLRGSTWRAWAFIVTRPLAQLSVLERSSVNSVARTYCCCFFREAVLLGPASTAVQRAGTCRSGRPCQQADGQVCCKVSTETALPVSDGKTMVGNSWALIVLRSIFTHSEKAKAGARESIIFHFTTKAGS